MIITKHAAGDYQFVKSGSKGQSNLAVEEELQEGIYVAKLNVKWNYFNSHECVVASYGPEPVLFKEMTGK